MPAYTIFAPHVDDECIGCYSLLKQGFVREVYYFYELSDVRRAEAVKAADAFGFKPVFDTPVSRAVVNAEGTTLCVPSKHDAHPDHLRLRSQVLLCAPPDSSFLFYSIDMNTQTRTTLSAKSVSDKRASLLMLYPSQSALFESDDKYSLFEGLSSDETSYTTRLCIRGATFIIQTEGQRVKPNDLRGLPLGNVPFMYRRLSALYPFATISVESTISL